MKLGDPNLWNMMHDARRGHERVCGPPRLRFVHHTKTTAREGKARRHSLVSEWISSGYTQCGEEKCSFGGSQHLVRLRSKVKTARAYQWQLIEQLLRWAYRLDWARNVAAFQPGVSPVPPDMGSTLVYLKALESASVKFDYLEEVIASLDDIAWGDLECVERSCE